MSSDDSPLLTVAKSLRENSLSNLDLDGSDDSGDHSPSSLYTNDSNKYRLDSDSGLDNQSVEKPLARDTSELSYNNNGLQGRMATKPLLRDPSLKPNNIINICPTGTANVNVNTPPHPRFATAATGPSAGLDSFQPVVKFRRHSLTPYDTAGGLLTYADPPPAPKLTGEDEASRQSNSQIKGSLLKNDRKYSRDTPPGQQPHSNQTGTPTNVASPAPNTVASGSGARGFKTKARTMGLQQDIKADSEEMSLGVNQGAGSSGFRSLRAGRLKPLASRNPQNSNGQNFDDPRDRFAVNGGTSTENMSEQKHQDIKNVDRVYSVLSTPDSVASTATGNLELSTETTTSYQTYPGNDHPAVHPAALSRAAQPKETGSAMPGFPAGSEPGDTSKAPATGLARYLDNGARYLTWADLKPLSSEPAQPTFHSILHKVGSSDWQTQFAAETDVRRIALFHPHTLAWPLQSAHAKRTGIYQSFSSSLMHHLAELGDSKRSNLAKNTFLVIHDMFTFASKHVAEPQTLEPALTVCFKKASSPAAGGFVLEETERALRQILIVGDELKILGCVSRTVKDAAFRLRARCLAAIGLVLLRSNQPHIIRILGFKDFIPLVKLVIRGVSDATAECRYAAKTSLLVILCLIQDIEARGRGNFSDSDHSSLHTFIDTSIAQAKPGAIAWAVSHYYDIKGLEDTVQKISDELPSLLENVEMTTTALDCISTNLQRMTNFPDPNTVARASARPSCPGGPQVSSPMNLVKARAMTPVAPQVAARAQDRATSAYSRQQLLQSPGSPTNRRVGCQSVQPQPDQSKSSNERYISSLRFRPRINVKDFPMAEQDEEDYADESGIGFQQPNTTRAPSQPKRQQAPFSEENQRGLGSVGSQPRLALGSLPQETPSTQTGLPRRAQPLTERVPPSQPQPVGSGQTHRAVTPVRTVPSRVLGGQSAGRASALRGSVEAEHSLFGTMGSGGDFSGNFGFRSRQPTKDKN